MSALSSLIARLEKAEGSNHELDHLIASVVLGRSTRSAKWTASLDAAVSLAERVLPNLSKIQPETYVGGEFHHCEIETEDGDFEAHNCPNPAIAICLATLRALQQKGSSND